MPRLLALLMTPQTLAKPLAFSRDPETSAELLTGLDHAQVVHGLAVVEGRAVEHLPQLSPGECRRDRLSPADPVRHGSLCRDHIDPLKPEVGRGGEEAAVVREDLLEPVFGGAGEVESVGGAEEGRGGCGAESGLQARQDAAVEGVPDEPAAVAFAGELVEGAEEGFAGEPPFAEGAVEGGDRLRLGVPGGG
jgi:hypothetical protein